MNYQAAANLALGYSQGLLIACLSGATGGLIYGIAAIVDTGKDKNGRYAVLRGTSFTLFILSRTLVGIGGGLAALLAALSIGRYADPPKPTDLLSLTTLCFVAGYIGHRILPAVAARVEKQLGDLRQKVEQAEDTAERAAKKAESSSDAADMGPEIFAARQLADSESPSPSLISRTIQVLESFLPQAPLNRSLHIVLARLYMNKENRDRAIELLREFIKNKRAEGKSDDLDVADALFNIACYYSRLLKSGAAHDADWRKEATNALKESIKIKPQNVDIALTDRDLEELRATKEFEALRLQKGASV